MRTIVGGRPSPRRPGGGGFPLGIDVLLRKAAVDPAFREALAADFLAAATSIGLALTSAERAVLRSVPPDALVEMAARVRVPEAHRATFRGGAAAAMLALLAGASAAGCSSEPPPSVPAHPAAAEAVGEREPTAWVPRAWVCFGAALEPRGLEAGAEADPDPGPPPDTNEPPAWNPPIAIAGLAIEIERRREFEAEDDPVPPAPPVWALPRPRRDR